MKRVLFLLILGLGFLPATLYAQDAQVILGNVQPFQLRIQINTGGNYCVYRNITGSAWQKQFYAENSHLFSIKIGSVMFSSAGTANPSAGSSLYTATRTAFDSIRDVGTPITSGLQQEMTKKFTGTYNGNTFTVTIKITYNTSSPDYLIKDAIIDATNIPSGTPIIFAYGWDTYVNTSDAGYAYIVPDIFSLNNTSLVSDRYLTTAQVQSLRMVGASNATGNGALIAFFPIGRDFDRAYSANPYNQAYCFNIPDLVPGNGTNSGAANQYKFQFGPFSGGADNGTGVGYDNIPAGQITEIKTGLTFTSSLDGELDYLWNGVKNHVANIGDNVSLNLNYLSYNSSTLTNVGFRVDFTGLQIRAGGCTSSGFTGGTTSCVVGNEFYQLSGATVAALGSATVSVPVNITRAGQWIVDGSAITNMTQTLPLGSPATLTVATTVSLDNNTADTICKGATKQYTVKFPGAVIAAQNVTVNLSYSGATASYSSLPATVVIPAGSNSANFAVTASPTGADNAAITITLNSINEAFATVAAPSSVQLAIDATPVLNSIGNQTTCAGTLQPAINFSGTNVDAANCTWTNNNTAIGLAASGTGSISTFTASNTTNVPISATITVTPISARGCSGTPATFTITVNPTPSIANQMPTICSGTAFSVSPTNGGGNIVPAGTTYTWTVSTNPNISGASNQATPQDSISQTLKNLTNAIETITYTVTPTSGTCTGQSFMIIVTVNPKPGITPKTASICSGTAFSVKPVNGNSDTVPDNTTYTWTILPNADISGASNQPTPQDSISQTLSNLTNTTQTITYTVTPTAGICTGATFPITVTVIEIVSISVNITASDTNICFGTAVTFTATATGDNSLAYQWKKNGFDVGTNSPIYVDTPENDDIITCVVTSSHPCVISSSVTSNSIKMKVRFRKGKSIGIKVVPK